MNDTTNNPTNNVPATVSWQTKAKYIGAGLFIGVVVAPLVKNILRQIQPKIDEVFESMTGKTDAYSEKASDVLYKAKEHMRHSPDQHSHEKHGPHPSRPLRKDESLIQDATST